ncbi:unnamed protein product [Closterium sp. NIES-54]
MATEIGEQPHGSWSCAALPAATALPAPIATTVATASTATATTATATATPATAIMASPTVLSFDAEGRPIKFDVWLDDLHLYLQITAKDDVSLYDHTSGAAPAPPTTADSTARSQWQTRDAHARLAVRSHLPLDEREHFSQHKTAKELYDAVVACYSSPGTAAIGRLSLPYLFPDLSAFATVADLITHLRTMHPLSESQSSPFLVQQLHVLLHLAAVASQPRVFGFTGSFPPGTQWSLRRPVYGLRQAPREWHDTLRTTLAALGFTPSFADPSMFLRTDTSLPPFYILVYVDDLVFATADTEALAHVKSKLQKRHTCTDLGELRSYLGLQITRDKARRTITLTQSHMVQQVLQRFGFTWSSAQATPLAIGHSLSALPSDESVEPSGPYPELVGCLMYLMTCTRPDLAYPLGLLARYVAPGRHRKVHWDATKRVLRYLCSISGMGLVLGGGSPVVLTGHSDASWVDDQATQRSSQGYTFSLGSGSVSWRSTRSSSVLSSSCEAEIYATAMAA